MICTPLLFFDRMVEMMIIVCAAPADMNPVDVLHCAKKFDPGIASSPLLQHSRGAAGTMELLDKPQGRQRMDPMRSRGRWLLLGTRLFAHN